MPDKEDKDRSRKVIIYADCQVHFKTGQSMEGALHEFILCSNSEEMKTLMQDEEFMLSIKGQDFAFVNLEQVVFINATGIKVVVASL